MVEYCPLPTRPVTPFPPATDLLAPARAQFIPRYYLCSTVFAYPQRAQHLENWVAATVLTPMILLRAPCRHCNAGSLPDNSQFGRFSKAAAQGDALATKEAARYLRPVPSAFLNGISLDPG